MSKIYLNQRFPRSQGSYEGLDLNPVPTFNLVFQNKICSKQFFLNKASINVTESMDMSEQDH